MGADYVFAFCPAFDERIHFRNGAIKTGYCKAFTLHIQYEVLTHNCQAYKADICLCHLFLLLLLTIIVILYGYYPTWYWLQLPYFVFWSVVLVLSIGWLTSSLRVFIKDINELVGVILQFGFWLTPIFWSIEMVPERYQFIVKLNPMFYIIDGYRNTFINQVWFWEQGSETLYFLATTAVLFVTGSVVFKRLRPHFGDVL